MTDHAQDALPLPGLNPDDRPRGDLYSAVRRTIARLDALMLLDERHAAQCALALTLAEAVEAGTRSRRASAVAMAARELRECLLALPEPDSGEDDPWTALVEQFLNADGKGAAT